MDVTTLSNGMWKVAHPDILKPRSLDAQDKIALDKKHTLLAEKAQQRQAECWMHDCSRRASVWVREVGYDFKGEKAAAVDHVAVSSMDYEGPVPGFCTFCLGKGPEELAQTVYFARPEMYWGVRPNRWFVSFTDDTRQGGMCIEIDPKQTMPKIIEQHLKGTE